MFKLIYLIDEGLTNKYIGAIVNAINFNESSIKSYLYSDDLDDVVRLLDVDVNEIDLNQNFKDYSTIFLKNTICEPELPKEQKKIEQREIRYTPDSSLSLNRFNKYKSNTVMTNNYYMKNHINGDDKFFGNSKNLVPNPKNLKFFNTGEIIPNPVQDVEIDCNSLRFPTNLQDSFYKDLVLDQRKHQTVFTKKG